MSSLTLTHVTECHYCHSGKSGMSSPRRLAMFLYVGFTKSADGPGCFRVLLAIEFTADAIPFPKIVVCQTVVADFFIVDRHVEIQPICNWVILTNYSKGKCLCFFVSLQLNQATYQRKWVSKQIYVSKFPLIDSNYNFIYTNNKKYIYLIYNCIYMWVCVKSKYIHNIYIRIASIHMSIYIYIYIPGIYIVYIIYIYIYIYIYIHWWIWLIYVENLNITKFHCFNIWYIHSYICGVNRSNFANWQARQHSQQICTTLWKLNVCPSNTVFPLGQMVGDVAGWAEPAPSGEMLSGSGEKLSASGEMLIRKYV